MTRQIVYRPISDLTILSKIIEKLIILRLLSFINQFFLISQSQFCFSNHSTSYNGYLPIHEEMYSELIDRETNGPVPTKISVDANKTFILLFLN